MSTSRLRLALKDWSMRGSESGHLPNLGAGGSLVTVFVTTYFAAALGGALLVILMYGPHAFFVEGLRVRDWKQGVLSNGQWVGPLPGLATFPCWIFLIACTEIAAGIVHSFLRLEADMANRNGPVSGRLDPFWLRSLARLWA